MIEPNSEAELAEALASAKGPFAVRGGGTRGPLTPGEVLSTAKLSGIELYEPGALTIVVKAGTPLEEVEAALDAEGQRLPFEPMDHRAVLGTTGTPTIGGVAAGNVSGPRRIQSGAARDAMLGVRFVDGQGSVVKNGGRVMKNVTGYDLVKLMAGSRGTLGVLTEVSFKVLPKPEAAACLLIEGLSDVRAIEALSMALGSPFEVNGAAHLQRGLDGAPVTMLRIEGFAEQVTYRAGQLQNLLSGFGESHVETNPDKLDAGWRFIRDAERFAGEPGDVWRLSVKPTDGQKVAEALPEAELFYDWGGGLVWARVAEGTDLRAHTSGLKGHATLVRAATETHARLGTFHPEPAPLAAISAGLRKTYDPNGVLNPGLMAAA